MIAEIIPIKRLPFTISLLDYDIPQEFRKIICVGQLVLIPFRNTEEYGIVFSIKKQDKRESHKIRKTIKTVLHTEPLVTQTHLTNIHTWSLWYGIALPTLLKMSLLPMQKRKIAKLALLPIKKHIKRKHSLPAYHQYTSISSHQALLENTINGSTLILVPEITCIDEIRQMLPLSIQKKTVPWHSGLSTKQQFERWIQIRNSEKTVILGTRSATFLPIPDLQTVIIDEEQREGHKHADSAPRFHVSDIWTMIANTSGIELHLMGNSPSVSTFFSVQLGQTKTTRPIPAPPPHKSFPSIIDMRGERVHHHFDCLSVGNQKKIQEANDDVFLFLNRKGSATRIGCRECGRVETCKHCLLPLVLHEQTRTLRCHYCHTSSAVPVRCSVCLSASIQLSGCGTELVETTVRNLLGKKHPHSVIRIDGDVNDLSYLGSQSIPRIIIGTEMAFPYIRWKKTQLIIFISIDQQLHIPEFMAQEHVWHLIWEVQYRRNAESLFSIQTMNPQQHLLESLGSPKQFYDTELNARNTFGYPPYTYLAKYLFGHPVEADAKKETLRMVHELHQMLTIEKRSVILNGPIDIHPQYYRRKYWYGILARMRPNTWTDDLVWLNAQFPKQWKIDPHPLSLLSP